MNARRQLVAPHQPRVSAEVKVRRGDVVGLSSRCHYEIVRGRGNTRVDS